MRTREIVSGVASCMVVASSGCGRPAEPTDQSPAVECTPPPPPATTTIADLEPPKLLAASFVAPDRVQLMFSEPLAPTAQVDPRQFRLSLANSVADAESGDVSGYYYDLGGTGTYQPGLIVSSLKTYEGQAEQLALQLNRAVPSDLCSLIAINTLQGRAGVFLHYTSHGGGVLDRAGNPLGDIGGDWALNRGARQRVVEGAEPVMRFDLLVELECDDDIIGRPRKSN